MWELCLSFSSFMTKDEQSENTHEARRRQTWVPFHISVLIENFLFRLTNKQDSTTLWAAFAGLTGGAPPQKKDHDTVTNVSFFALPFNFLLPVVE